MRTPAAREGVSEMVAVILLVAITVVLTGVLYIIVTDLANSQAEVPPRILLTEINPGNPRIFQVSASEVKPLSEFQIRVWIDGAVDSASIMDPVVVGTVGNVSFADAGGGGGMSDGDTIAVQTAIGHRYEIFLLWKGTVMDHRTWQS